MSAQSSAEGPPNKGQCPTERGHPLSKLPGKPLGPYRLLVQLGTKNRFGARYFQVFLGKPPAASDSALDRTVRERAKEIIKGCD